MAQWFLRMTEYADELLDELDHIEFPENVKAMQELDWPFTWCTHRIPCGR